MLTNHVILPDPRSEPKGIPIRKSKTAAAAADRTRSLHDIVFGNIGISYE